MKSIAEQSVEALGGRMSVLARQKRDHIKLDALLHQLEGTTAVEQETVLNRINRLVFSHAFAEEAVLWPVIRRALRDGEALTLRVENEHQEVNELVTALENDRAEGPVRSERIRRLVEVLREDVRDEEDVLFPRLQQVLDAKQLRRLGLTWEAVRRTAPTRPHPVVARRPPGNAVAALPLTVIDRSRDAIDATARRTGGRMRPALESLSGRLAHIAGRVEHLELLRRGERPETHVPD